MDDTNQSISSSADINNNNPHQDDVKSETDDVTFAFNHLQINTNNNSNPQDLIPESSKAHYKVEEQDHDEEDEDDDDEVEDEDDDFTFVCVGDNNNDDNDLLLASDVLEDGQIRKAFPLFDQSLLSSDNYDDGNGKRRLPIDVPVDKVFIESPRRSPSDNGETDGTLTALPKESEMNMKSNSTGFSKLWRFRNNQMNRSHSDGRDAFVFLESSDATTSDGKQKAVKVNGKGVSKGKKITASAHEVYLKQKKKGGQTEEERRRSYLPYRPGLMGFFTNVNGGLSKNVHPF